MSKLTLKQVVKGLFDALNAKKADRSDLEGLATASDVEEAKEEIISNEDNFRTALMGKDGYLAIRPMFGIVINNTQTDTQTISHIYTTETQPSTYQLQDFQNTEEELDALERIDYKIPVPGTTYYFPKGVFSGIELLEPASGGLRTYYVPTAAPLNILTTDGQGNETLNYDGLVLLPLGRGSRVKCLKEVKYYNHTTQGTVKDDDESGIDYAHTEGYTYILSVYVYEADAEGTEISLNDIDGLIGVPATGQPSTLFAAVAAGGSSDTLQAILAAVKDGNYTAIGVTKDVQTKVGAKDSSDATEPSTLFDWFRKLFQNILSMYSAVYNVQNSKSAVSEAASANTKIGTNADNASDSSGSGTIFGKLRAIIELLKNDSYGLSEIESEVANAGTAAGTAANKAESADDKLGNKDDSADDTTTGSVFARLRAIINKLGTNADQASELSGSGTIFGRLRAIIDNYLDNSQYGLGKIYSDTAKESAATANKASIIAGAKYVEAVGVPAANNQLEAIQTGQTYQLTGSAVTTNNYAVGDVIFCKSRQSAVSYLFKTLTNSPSVDAQGVVTGVVEAIQVKEGTFYQVTGVVSAGTVSLYTFVELPASVVGAGNEVVSRLQGAGNHTLEEIVTMMTGRGGEIPQEVEDQLELIIKALGLAAPDYEFASVDEIVTYMASIWPELTSLPVAPVSISFENGNPSVTTSNN